MHIIYIACAHSIFLSAIVWCLIDTYVMNIYLDISLSLRPLMSARFSAGES